MKPFQNDLTSKTWSFPKYILRDPAIKEKIKNRLNIYIEENDTLEISDICL